MYPPLEDRRPGVKLAHGYVDGPQRSPGKRTRRYIWRTGGAAQSGNRYSTVADAAVDGVFLLSRARKEALQGDGYSAAGSGRKRRRPATGEALHPGEGGDRRGESSGGGRQPLHHRLRHLQSPTMDSDSERMKKMVLSLERVELGTSDVCMYDCVEHGTFSVF